MLYQVIMPDNTTVIVPAEEFPELKKALDYMGLDYHASVVGQKMYAIHWYDHLDEVWSIIWCTEENYREKLREVINAGAEYEIIEYN